jgi:hypothetical protein
MECIDETVALIDPLAEFLVHLHQGRDTYRQSKSSCSGSEHLLVGLQELLPGLLPYGLRQFGWPVTVAEFYCLAEAFGKRDARRTTGKVSLDVLAGVGRKLQVQVLGKQ